MIWGETQAAPDFNGVDTEESRRKRAIAEWEQLQQMQLGGSLRAALEQQLQGGNIRAATQAGVAQATLDQGHPNLSAQASPMRDAMLAQLIQQQQQQVEAQRQAAEAARLAGHQRFLAQSQATPVAVTGSVNGQPVMAPGAGHAGVFNASMAKLGYDNNAMVSPEALRQREVEQARMEPGYIQAMDKVKQEGENSLAVERTRGQAAIEAAGLRGLQLQRQKEAESQKLQQKDRQAGSKAFLDTARKSYMDYNRQISEKIRDLSGQSITKMADPKFIQASMTGLPFTMVKDPTNPQKFRVLPVSEEAWLNSPQGADALESQWRGSGSEHFRTGFSEAAKGRGLLVGPVNKAYQGILSHTWTEEEVSRAVSDLQNLAKTSQDPATVEGAKASLEAFAYGLQKGKIPGIVSHGSSSAPRAPQAMPQAQPGVGVVGAGVLAPVPQAPPGVDPRTAATNRMRQANSGLQVRR